MNVSLTPELDALIQRKVESGMYHSASEVVRDGLRLLEERDRRETAKLESLRAAVKIGIDQIERGEYTTYTTDSLSDFVDDVKALGRARLKAASDASAS